MITEVYKQTQTIADQTVRPLRICVAIATRGRAEVLLDTLSNLRLQTRPPETIVVSYAEPEDVQNVSALFPEVRLLSGPAGLTRQRNTVLDALGDEDVLLFLDDDFHLHVDYLRIMEDLFLKHPEVHVATGTVLADGVHGPLAVTPAEAASILSCGVKCDPLVFTPLFNGYGCNMLFRMETVRRHHIRFDEKLPLYGWYEDVDFSRRVSRHGASVRLQNAVGVHLGVKSARQPGLRLGYSQVANPIYLARKGSLPWYWALSSVASRTAKNLTHSLRPEPHIDRMGRLRGNLLAYRDLLLGRLCPTRILSL